MDKTLENFSNLLEIIRRLRAPDGCPWDKEQTPYTMRSSVLEECYEVLDALADTVSADEYAAHAKEELGDLLFNVLMVSYMFEQAGDFSIGDVLKEVSEKIVRRHPHVFGKTEGFAGPDSTQRVTNPADVLKQWDKIKETVEKRTADSVLDSVPKTFPPVMRAYKLQKKVAKVGFDFADVFQARTKVSEELAELDAEIQKTRLNPKTETPATSEVIEPPATSEAQAKALEAELGDVLFSVINLARLLEINPDLALQNCNTKFMKRFRYVEKGMQEKELPMNSEQAQTMNELWEKAKLQ